MLHLIKRGLSKSGIKYLLAFGNPLQGTDMEDSINPFNTVIENPLYPWARIYREGVLQGILDTFNILMGNHYEINLQGKGRKGVLDIFILPLISRFIIFKLVESFLPPANLPNRPPLSTRLRAALVMEAWLIAAIPAAGVEVARTAAALVLTAVLSPLVLAVHALTFFKARKLKKAVSNFNVSAEVTNEVGSTVRIQKTLSQWMKATNVSSLNDIRYVSHVNEFHPFHRPNVFKRTLSVYPEVTGPFLIPQDNVSNDPQTIAAFQELNIGKQVRIR